MDTITETLQQIDSDSISHIADTLKTSISHQLSTTEGNSPFSLNSLIGYMLSGIFGLIIGVSYSMFIESKVRNFLSKTLPKLFRKKLTLDGKWEQNWFVESTSFPKENKSEVILKQRNNKVSGSFEVEDNNNIKYKYFMSGAIKNNQYIEGEWYDQYDGNTYHGTFLLSIDINMNKLTGNWIGTARGNNVKSDKWIWNKI